ncbi:MAG: protein translocase subunit SecD [Rhodobacteraceae bacterium]|nr:protein translocase subunit SecD [Paracoccaceae bacterium]
MLHFPLWKKLMILGLCAFGIILALPNAFYTTVEKHNDAVAVLEQPGVIETPELIADRDGWPSVLPSDLVNLGLDLRGGVQLLVRVEVEDVYRERLDSMWPEVRNILRDNRDAVGTVRNVTEEGSELRVRIGNEEAMPLAIESVRTLTRPVVTLTGAGSRDFEVRSEGDELILTLSDAEKTATDDRTMLQSLEIIRRRVDESGTREPIIQRQGADRILIQVPGIGSAEELLALIGKTAKLTFNHVITRTSDPDANPGIGNVLVPDVEVGGGYYVLERSPVVGGEQLVDAQPSFDQNGRPAVSFRFNPTGARLFGAYTAANIGNPFAIVLDGEVISAPVIQAHIPGGSGIITGNFGIEESTNLAILLRAGALPAEIITLEQRTTGPELGADSIQAGKVAAVVAFVGVLVFMVLSYGLFGIFANVALVLNIALLFGLLSVIGATLTLPGIAGIVLTLGMAVDANVLVFERIREELKTAKGPARAIEIGYEKAFSAIIDANVTTLIAAVILFAMGSGPVKGFAVTLGLGIITSVFTAIWVTRLLIATWFKLRNPKTIEV